MKWLAECSVAALREALGTVAPELSGYPVTVPGSTGQQDPLWHPGCVPAGDRFFVTFAWSRPAALRLAREIGVLTAPAGEPEVPFVPEVVASSADLHGDNRVRDRDKLRLVLDFENIGAAEPEYELRGFPGPGMGPGLAAADRDHAPLPAGHRTAAVARPGNGLASAPRPRRRAVAQRSRPPADRSPDTTTVGRGPGRALQHTQHRPRSATRKPAPTAPPRPAYDATPPRACRLPHPYVSDGCGHLREQDDLDPGPFGAKGCGEGALARFRRPSSTRLASAGVPINTPPLTPERV